MSQAAHLVLLGVIRQEPGPIADFDLLYFMSVIREFVSDHQILRQTLEGKTRVEEWFPDV